MSELKFIPSLFEKLKSISFLDRIFKWKNVNSLVIDSYNEFKILESFSTLANDINIKNTELSNKDKEIVKLNELKNLELSQRDKDIIRLKQIEESLKNNLLKIDKENSNLVNKNELLNQQFIEVEKKLSTTEEKLSRQEKDYSSKTNELNLAIHDFKESKLKLQQDKENEKLQELIEMKNTWKKHQLSY